MIDIKTNVHPKVSFSIRFFNKNGELGQIYHYRRKGKVFDVAYQRQAKKGHCRGELRVIYGRPSIENKAIFNTLSEFRLAFKAFIESDLIDDLVS